MKMPGMYDVENKKRRRMGMDAAWCPRCFEKVEVEDNYCWKCGFGMREELSGLVDQ